MDVTIFVMPVAQHVSSYILSFYSCDNLPHILNFCNYQIVQILYFSFLICTSLIPKVPEHFSRTYWLVVVPALRSPTLWGPGVFLGDSGGSPRG